MEKYIRFYDKEHLWAECCEMEKEGRWKFYSVFLKIWIKTSEF